MAFNKFLQAAAGGRTGGCEMRAVRSLSTRGYEGILPQKNLKFEI